MSYYADDLITLHHGDAASTLAQLDAQSVNCIVTSPPYFGLRDYGDDGQIGAEATPAEFIASLVNVFREARRVLADDGTLWLNLGDSYSTYAGNRGASTGIESKRKRDPRPKVPKGAGLSGDRPMKNLLGMPWRTVFALQDDGWTLRAEIIWEKDNHMPESVSDRPTRSHETVFLLTKRPRYWYDPEALREASGANAPSVWRIPTSQFPGAHFATMPPELARRCIVAGCKPGGTVLDPFSGSGTTGLAATENGRRYVGIDLNAGYLDLSLRTRLRQGVLDLGQVS